MSRIITFSTKYPSYHPRKGEPTFFVEKLAKAMHRMGSRPWDIECDFDIPMYHLCEPKFHTIRAGNRWKVGDKFSPRVWSARPYASPMISIAPDIEIKKTWDFSYKGVTENYFRINGVRCTDVQALAQNDGLSVMDLKRWFKKPMMGQIICWNEKIEY